METITAQVILAFIGWEVLKFLINKFLTKTVDTEYVTMAECDNCDKHIDIASVVSDLRHEQKAMKRILILIADRQGIKVADFSEIISGDFNIPRPIYKDNKKD